MGPGPGQGVLPGGGGGGSSQKPSILPKKEFVVLKLNYYSPSDAICMYSLRFLTPTAVAWAVRGNLGGRWHHRPFLSRHWGSPTHSACRACRLCGPGQRAHQAAPASGLVVLPGKELLGVVARESWPVRIGVGARRTATRVVASLGLLPPPHADTAGVAHQAESGLRGRGCRFAVSFPTQGSLAWSASSAEAFLFRWTPGSGERGRGSKKVFHNEGVSCLKSVPFQLSKLFWSERPRSLGLQASLRDTGKGESCSLPPPPRR